MTNKLDLPSKREFGWVLKPVSSAKTAITKQDNGQIEVTIAHDLIKGITTEMLVWWFQNFINLTVTKGGVDYPAYFLWHPYDHISVTSNSGVPTKKGDIVTLHEAFQREAKFEVHEQGEISVLDAGNMGLRGRKLGHTIMDLRHSFHDVPEGVIYNSRVLLGTNAGFLKPLINNLVVPRFFDVDKANAWLRHNVEEVGCFENFLGELYAHRDQGAKIVLD